jgi:hypothetical protein
MNLNSGWSALIAATTPMQSADVAPTAGDLANATRVRAQAKEVLDRWNAVKTKNVAALNAKRKAAGKAPV